MRNYSTGIINYAFLLLPIICLPCILSAQRVTISGFIKDRDTGERLIGAHVYIPGTSTGSTSSNYGFYSISVQSHDSTDLIISYIGYLPIRKKILPVSNISMDFFLEASTSLTTGVDVISKELPIHRRLEMSIISIPVNQIKGLPSLAGESDILKALQLMPGVRAGNEGSSDLYVRGGSPDQNMILLDDVPLYYVNHLGGFVSIFNTDAIQNIKLYKGGFPARFGGRLSSVVDVRMKDGNSREFQGKATIGLLTSKISIEGPLAENSASYMISFRRFMYDLVSRPLSKIIFDGVSMGYNFYDLNLKLNYQITSKDRIFFSIYNGDDVVMIRNKKQDPEVTTTVKDHAKWGNHLAALRWNHLYNPHLFSNLTLTYTRYRHQIINSFNRSGGDIFLNMENSFRSEIGDFSGAMDFEYFSPSGYVARFGKSLTFHDFLPGVTTYSQNSDYLVGSAVFGNYNIKAIETAVYLENEIKTGNHITSNIGLRLSSYYTNGSFFLSPEPRVLINILINETLSLNTSWARMQQYVHLLSSSGAGIPLDLWVPSTDMIRPSVSNQWACGIAQSIKNGAFELTAETYFKRMNDLIAYKEGAIYLSTSEDWQNKVETGGKGWMYGLEFLIQKKEGQTTGWLGYTLSRALRQFDNLNSGNPFVYKYDRLHDVSIVCNHKLNDKVSLSATWVYGTGNAFTLANQKYMLTNDDSDYGLDIHIYEGINTFRMRAFHKLDIGASFTKQKRRGNRIWNISIYNVYNRQNPYYYFFETQESRDNQGYIIEGSQKTVLKQQSLFPFMPSVSYSFTF